MAKRKTRLDRIASIGIDNIRLLKSLKTRGNNESNKIWRKVSNNVRKNRRLLQREAEAREKKAA